jgi:adenylosuccinate lyase
VQRAAMQTWESVRSGKALPTGEEFKQALLADAEAAKHLTKTEVEELFNLKRHLRDVDRTFQLLGLG